ncbi:hypothetical protein HZC27_01620 [Candidatus Roizmanbacteria bacterium]|nr:hypothetical protein [Candidatus Roizmanbacteria bacterium]
MKKLFIAILLIVFTVAGFYYFSEGLRKKSKAAPTGTPEVILEAVDSPPMQTDNGIKVAVKLNPNGITQELYSFDVEVKFDTAKIDFKNAGGVDANVSLAQGLLKQQVVMVGSDIIHIVGTRVGTPFSPTSQSIAEITFKMKTGSTFPVEFGWGNVALQSTNFVKVPLSLASNTSSSSSSSQANEGVKLSFLASKPTYRVGDTVSLEVLVGTANQQIGSVGVNITFDPALLDYVSTAVDTNTFDQTALTPTTNTSPLIISAARKTGISGNMKIATMKFTAKAAGTANFTFDKAKSTVYTFSQPAQNILNTVTPYSITVADVSSSSSSSTGSSLTPTPLPVGEEVESNGDLLNVNAVTFDQAPLRYEQTVKLDSGRYTLSGSAYVYTTRGRGVLLVLTCGEGNCGNGKKLNDILVKTPLFPVAPQFQQQEADVIIPDAGKDKKYKVRIYVEDGSEADFDFVSLQNIWGGEQLTNPHFADVAGVVSPRKYPEFWDIDTAGLIFGTVDKMKVKAGALFINSSSRQ